MVTDAAGSTPGPTPPTPPLARRVFGYRLPLAERYAALLADTGISHGLIGPREAPRLWDRHLLNCAVVHPLFREGSTVVDIGSGAGLPGLVLAIARPDLQLTLVEPLQRRTVWLESTVKDLGLDNVVVHRGRAESLWGTGHFRYATARAVARLAPLAQWALPLVEEGGMLHALKGSSAEAELAEDHDALQELGVTHTEISRFGAGVVDPETVVVSLTVGHRSPHQQGQHGQHRQGGHRPPARPRRRPPRPHPGE